MRAIALVALGLSTVGCAARLADDSLSWTAAVALFAVAWFCTAAAGSFMEHEKLGRGGKPIGTAVVVSIVMLVLAACGGVAS